ncbi:unnamed protein product [Symbiodinium necroappetens]|uniref:Ubiquitin-like domain-containing protein n=1 Tax=Symbiodinium necroappetens TaxID=1628268 RepID=A0A812VI79_9DINO|nr:unnamed protein product [Symbiodinium necroappetens]
MEGGFAIALVALATWAALLPGAFWEALGLAVRDGGRLAKGQALTTKPLLGGVAKGTPQEEPGMLLGAVKVVTPGTRSQIQSDNTGMKRSHEAMVGEGQAGEVFRAEPPSVTFVVLGPSGQEIGRFRLPREAQALDLKQAVEESTGLPRETQQVLIGHRRVEDEEMLLAGGDTPDLAEVEATLLVQLPVPTTRLEVQWKQLPETDGYLEELRVLNLARAGRRGWPPKEVLVPTARMGCVGIDPESGLLVLVGGGLPEHFGRRNGARYGYDSGEGSDSLHASELEDADGDKKRPSGPRVEYLPFSWKPGYRRQHPARRRNYEERCYSFRNSARNSLLVMPADSPAFSLPLDGHDPLVTAVEMHAMSSLQGYPFPSVGLAVALATGSRRKFAGPLQLIACELSPVTARTVCLTPADADCQAVCLDRGKEVAISAEVHSDGTYIGFYRLRPCQAASAERLRAEGGSCGRRATSIAWSEPANAVLLTFAGEHAIYVYQRVGAAWQPLQTLGDASSRGCQDGPASELRFWFPCGDCRLLQGPYGSLMKDSFPLLPGPGGAIYVHSGGALLLLAADLTSARKITSMREELWLTEDDEGTPIFPTCQNVFGVHSGSVYRSLVRTNDTEEVLIRRLQISAELRRPRSDIRATAPKLWPSITEQRIYHAELAFGPQIAPTYYHDSHRDKWDGNVMWLSDDWLWEDCPHKKPQDLRVSVFGMWTTFASWRATSSQYSCGESNDSQLRISYEDACKPVLPWKK